MNIATIPAYQQNISSEEIVITDDAKAQLSQLFGQVEDDEIEAIRIYVTGGGCSGMTYGMTFTDACQPFDKVLNEDGFDVYVDAVALNYLRGVEIDFVSRPTGASFVFNNVFAATGGSGTCSACGAAGGCGA
ncbi:MAG: iron-sulfur cluster assembly accessory protein [Gammaproteobacteria bacterium]|nr:iron-sulfur cluster assembly accessory protein [Gammaproteobacteria bacterium]